MADVKVKVYTPQGLYVGYFLNPIVQQYPESEYEISGQFFDENGQLTQKLDFNPETLPYFADMTEHVASSHVRLTRVYIQRGRQPVTMTGVGGA